MSEVLVLHHGERSFHPYSWPPHSQGGLAEPRRNPGLGTRTVLQVALSLFFYQVSQTAFSGQEDNKIHGPRKFRLPSFKAS